MNKLLRIIDHPLSVSLLVLGGLLALYFWVGIDINHPLYVITALTGGWMVAFHSSRWHEKNRFINEIRYESAKKLIEISSAVAQMATSLNGDVGSLRSNLNLRKGEMGGVFRDWGDIYTKVSNHFDEYQRLHLEFHRVYEENELLLMEFRPHLNVLTQHWAQLSKTYYDFHETLHTLILIHPEIPTQDEHTAKIREKMETLSECSMDVVCLYFDVRIYLLNATLGKIAKRKIPERCPQDPKFMTLSKLAKNANTMNPSEMYGIKK